MMEQYRPVEKEADQQRKQAKKETDEEKDRKEVD